MIKHVGKMTVAAHRGLSYDCYENTMTAFEAAWRAGADMIETDVHLTKDGALILMHDSSVDRTTDGSGKIADKTLQEILALNAGDKYHPEKVPLFFDFMEWATEKDLMLNIEIKEYYKEGNEERAAKCVDEVIALVERYGMREKTVINSFDAWVLERVYKKHGKKYMLHGFYPYDIMKNVERDPTEYLYCACIFKDTDKACYDFLLEHGIEPWIGAGVTQQYKLKICAELGARLVTTNNPADAIEKLKREGLRDES